jgi:hypothetical protein
MRYIILAISSLIAGCVHPVNNPVPADTKNTRSSEYQKEIDTLLALDADNKKWERLYLREIARAQDNDDDGAYKFFIIEFIKIPRLILPEWITKEPGFVPKLTDAEILRREFMTNSIDW